MRKLAGPVTCRRRIITTFLILAVLSIVTGCEPDGKAARKPGVSRVKPRHKPGVLRVEPRPPRPEDVWPPVAVWVPRHKSTPADPVYKSPQEIAILMDNCKRAGFNTVLFQVRGNGTAFYRSSIEPFAYEYKGDPGFDPLEVACREAHRRGMALHAWVNVMPAWRGERPPADRRQLYNARPEWFWYDQAGRRQPLIQRGEPWYVSLNPCLPEVRRYLVGVFEEIVRKYPIDGLHLDYIRFPSETSPKASDYPFDSRTLELYKKTTGKKPQQDRTGWKRWRTDQVTQLVRDIRQMVRRVRPRAKLTAACGADLNRYRNDFFQAGPYWLKGNLIDMVFVMNYTADVQLFRKRQEAWRRAAPGKLIAAGIGVYMHKHKSDRVTIEQIRLAKKWGGGMALFSSNYLFDLTPRSRQCLTSIRKTLPAM